jgi:hypothetical protein
MLYKFPFYYFEKNQSKVSALDAEISKRNTENKVIVCGAKRSPFRKWEHFVKPIDSLKFK